MIEITLKVTEVAHQRRQTMGSKQRNFVQSFGRSGILVYR